ncbi:MAG: hypothetical protein B7733_14690 [Myxococcales bacterium FL481]|nr:MAG: hypothetical protein B7733_14690 [Myxococcales bacterium FL481]
MRPTGLQWLRWTGAIGTVWLAACQAESGPKQWPDDYADLMDPETCRECHPDHVRQWEGSMHAYAADDPVFLAMNRRGQRETNGELGDFCIKCHAPMAVALETTVDGLNVGELPQWQKGVTCYFCHNTIAADGTHNNPLELARDGVMRAAVDEPVPNPVHESAYSSLLHETQFDSSRMCGSCHDIVTPRGLDLERTYKEWQNSVFSHAHPTDPDRPALYATMCTQCHAETTDGPISTYEGARGDRSHHDHRFVGIDVALTPFPTPELAPVVQADQLAGIAEARDRALCTTLCVESFPEQGRSVVTAWLHNEGSGHSWPSGAAQDRRAWVEVIARSAAGVVFESGVVAEGQPVVGLPDPSLWLLRDTLFDDLGQEVHMFWDAARYESNLLTIVPDLSSEQQTWVSRRYEIPDGAPQEVTMRVRLRPMGLDVLDDLIASGDLAPAVRAAMITQEAPLTRRVWTPTTGEPSPLGGTCVHQSVSCFAPQTKASP